MKKGDKKRQQKALAKRTEHDRERAASVRRQTAEHKAIRQAASYPILGCWAQQGWQDAGIAAVVVARRQPDGRVAFGDYVVDFYCLGVKDCFARANIAPARFEQDMLRSGAMGGPAVPISVEVAHELIYGSIDYAARWGFEPHPDFDLARDILDAPDRHRRTGAVTFGHDGKPFFVEGPHDDAEAIMQQLLQTAGPGNFDFLILAPGEKDLGPDDWTSMTSG